MTMLIMQYDFKFGTGSRSENRKGIAALKCSTTCEGCVFQNSRKRKENCFDKNTVFYVLD